MVTADAVIHGDRTRLIGFSDVERPVALQLGGAEPARLAEATRVGVGFGYDEVNLNVGCPSDRVQSGRFGACLMREPALVADLFAAMQEAAQDVPVTVKCRIGVDDQDPEASLFGFVATVSGAGCRTFVVHARKALLQGLSPKENRDVPPLDYALVRRLKTSRPDLEIVLNGGLGGLDHALAEMEGVDGVMLGRVAYKTPAELLEVDARVFGQTGPATDAVSAVEAYLPYISARLIEGVPLHAMTRHMLGLFHAKPGGRLWRRVLSEDGVRRGAGVAVVQRALDMVRQSALETA